MSTTTLGSVTNQEDPPNAVFPPFIRGRTGRKGCTKYIQFQSGSWVTLNPDGSCHLGARHKYLGNLLEVAGELEQRKEYADAWRINMQRAERDLATCRDRMKELELCLHGLLGLEGKDTSAPKLKGYFDHARQLLSPK